MSFLSILRERNPQNRLVRDPMEPGFDEELFNKCFLDHHDGSPEDYSAVLFGALTGQRVRRIYESLKHLKTRVRRCSYDEIAHAVADFLESQQDRLFSDYLATFTGRTQITAEALHNLRSAEDAHGNRFTPQEVLEAMVDGVKHILRDACDGKGFGGAGGSPDVTDLQIIVGSGIRLGSALESLRTQWHAVLWTGARATVDLNPPHKYVIDKRSAPLAAQSLVDIERRQGVLSRDSEATSVRHSPSSLLARKVLWLDATSAGGPKLKVVFVQALPEQAQQLAIGVAAAYEGFIDPQIKFFLDGSCSSLKGLTYRVALDALFCIALLVLIPELADRSSGEAVDGNPSRVRLNADELANGLRQALDIKADQALALIKFFTYSGRHQTLWTRPLLATSTGIIPLRWPLQGAHLMRLVNEWAKSEPSGDSVFSDKGHRYEEAVSRILGNASQHPETRTNFIAFQHRLNVPGKTEEGNDIGDVDCAFIIDQTLFLLECRAVPHPAEAFEFWSANEDLQKKVSQVLRKKRFIETHPEVVRTWRRQDGEPVSTKISQVVPLVVSNSFLVEGERSQEPYFVHLDTLFNLLFTGGSLFGLGFDNNDQEIGVLVDRRLRASSPVDAIIDSLRNPAKAEAFKAALKEHRTVVAGWDETDASGIVHELVLQFPEDSDGLMRILESCSFAQHMLPVGFG